MKKTILRTAAAMLMLCIVACGVGCGSGIEQPEWLKQAICEHDFNEKVIIKEPTCTESGSAQKFCSKCGMEKMIIQKALGHTEIVDEEIAATCTQPGLTAGSHCSVCGVVTVKQEEIEAKHTDKDLSGICERCGESIFDGASYVAVNRGDILSGWYRVSVDEGETYGILMCSNVKFVDHNEIKLREGTSFFEVDIKRDENQISLKPSSFSHQFDSPYDIIESFEPAKAVTYNESLYFYVDPSGYEGIFVEEEINMETEQFEVVKRDTIILKDYVYYNFALGTLEKVVFN